MSDRFVVDMSIVMTCCFADEANQYGDAALEALADANAGVHDLAA